MTDNPTPTRVRYSLDIDSGNQAVVDDPAEAIANALEIQALRLRNGWTEGTVRDTNGNRIGEWHLCTEDGGDDE